MFSYGVKELYNSQAVIRREYPKEASGWRDGIYYKRTAHDFLDKAAISSQGVHFSISNFTENTPALADDPKTIGNFEYLCGTTILFPAEAKNYHVSLTVEGLAEHESFYQIIVNQLPIRCFAINGLEKKTVNFDCFLSKKTFELTFKRYDSVEKNGELLVSQITLEEFQIPISNEQTIYLLSDSTVQSYRGDDYPQGGWGEFLAYFLTKNHAYQTTNDPLSSYPQPKRMVSTDVTVVNKAIGGRSSRSFIEEGKLQESLREIKKNDYILIQWGDNDATPIRPMRYVAPEDFHFYLEQYIIAALTRGAKPVLVTPPPQNKFTSDHNAVISFEKYRAVMLQLAQHYQIACIDLGKQAADLLSAVGPILSKALFMDFPKNQYVQKVAGSTDKTHFTKFGAKQMAAIVAKQFCQLFPEFHFYPEASFLGGKRDLTITSSKTAHQMKLEWQGEDAYDFYRVDTLRNQRLLGTTYLLHPYFMVTKTQCSQRARYVITAYHEFKVVAAGSCELPS